MSKSNARVNDVRAEKKVINSYKITTIYLGYPGHYILSDQCLFRLCTLVSSPRSNIIVSTVGCLYSNDGRLRDITPGSKYETCAFYAYYSNDSRKWLPNTRKQISVLFPVYRMSDQTEISIRHQECVDDICERLLKNEL